MTLDPLIIAARVRDELEAYSIPEPHPLAVGSALPPEWFAENLADMRVALVEPYLVRLEVGAPKEVLIVADDQDGSLVAYDPSEEGDFALLLRQDNQIYDCQVRGDAVGCFLSR